MPSRRKDQKRMMISFPVFFFSLFCFLLKKRRRPSSLQWREEGEFFLFYFHKERWQEMAYGANSFSLFLLSLLTSRTRPFLLLSFPFSSQIKSLSQGEEWGNEIMQRKIPSGAKDGIWRDTILLMANRLYHDKY